MDYSWPVVGNSVEGVAEVVDFTWDISLMKDVYQIHFVKTMFVVALTLHIWCSPGYYLLIKLWALVEMCIDSSSIVEATTATKVWMYLLFHASVDY